MNQEGCFITYFDLVDKVKEVARSNDFIVSEVRSFDNMCYVWVVDEGDPATTVSKAMQVGYDVKNTEIERWKRTIQ